VRGRTEQQRTDLGRARHADRERQGPDTPLEAGGTASAVERGEIGSWLGRREFLKALVADDGVAAHKLHLWPPRRGAWPEDLDCEELAAAFYEHPERRTPTELVPSSKLEETLVGEGIARRRPPPTGCTTARARSTCVSAIDA